MVVVEGPRRLAAALVLSAGISGCAIVSYDISPDANACRSSDGKIELSFKWTETVRGSLHTPLDYGNKSTASWNYMVKLKNSAVRNWTSEDLEVFVGGRPKVVSNASVDVTAKEIHISISHSNGSNGGSGITKVTGILHDWNAAKLSLSLACVP